RCDADPAVLRARAEAELPPLLAEWAARMGVEPRGLRITAAERRLGSCSADDRICLSQNLMRWPAEVIEYVVVHELAHIRHKNHGPAFYAEIAKFLPDYRRALAILRGK
ncbi:MAG: M48 family metallopeptidase, partial [Clostridia bacterium]|nr:M48 family metallopeptidase [Clostridia bacterium]